MVFAINLVSINLVFAQLTNIDWKVHNVGKVRQAVTNTGNLSPAVDPNVGGGGKYGYPGLINSEFPPNSNEEHIYLSGIWIGAITEDGDTLVSVTKTHFTPDEFYPTAAKYDTIWVVSKGVTVDIPYRPNYTGISDQNFICRYSDYNVLNVEDHTPLYLDVVQTSYAWSSYPLDEFLVFQYDIVPTIFDLRNVFVAYWQQGEVGNNAVGDNYADELTLFFPENRMGVTADGEGGNDGNAISPIGVKILNPQDTTLVWTYKYYTHEALGSIARDANRYEAISSGEIMQDVLEPQLSHWTISFGPLEYLSVGDTLHFEMAAVFGEGIEGMMKNADYVTELATRDYKVPSPPPMPAFEITLTSHEVHLSWYPQEGHPNPETYTDPYRGDQEAQPFEGYRVYKSAVSATGPWTLLAEYDLPDNEYGQNTGLNYEYTDVGLLNNLEYYYTVTAFSKPDTVIEFPSLESSASANTVTAVPGTAPPETVGNVAVVPNPYRGDIEYHASNPKWDPSPPGRTWLEQDRRIQFINLPGRCEITIYTLAGDWVETLRHDDPDRGYEDWNLTSSVGQAISSGIYLFTVKDSENGDVQVGKFVVIK